MSTTVTTAEPTTDLAAACGYLKLASDPTRLTILRLLAGGPLNVGALATALGQSQPVVSRHLGLMRLSGFLAATRRGKEIHYSLEPRGRAAVNAAAALVGA